VPLPDSSHSKSHKASCFVGLFQLPESLFQRDVFRFFDARRIEYGFIGTDRFVNALRFEVISLLHRMIVLAVAPITAIGS
jgi:hypothetical protein